MWGSAKLKCAILRKNYNVFRLYMKLTNKKPKVENSIKTINYILQTNCSMARFGDGEFYWIFQKRAEGNFEKNSNELSLSLKKVLNSNLSNMIVCIPDVFDNLDNLTAGAQHFWQKYLFKEGFATLRLLNKSQQYYDTQCTRPYMDYVKNNGRDFDTYFNLIKQIWKNRNVLIIEGEKSRFGVNSDILNNAKSVRRVLCPSENAFEVYDEILEKAIACVHTINNPIVLASLGPTATILSYDLSRYNIQTIDVGHLDVEYQWFKMGASKKVSIPGKYVNEAKDKFTAELPSDILSKYYKEVIAKVGEE